MVKMNPTIYFSIFSAVEVAAEVVAVTAEMEDAMTTMVVAVVDTVVAEVVAAVVVEDMEAVAAVDLPLLITEAVHEEITAHVPDLILLVSILIPF